MAVNVRFGSKADMEASPRDVRFTPKSRHWLSASGCLLCAKSGHMQCSKTAFLFDDFVGAREQRERDIEAERLSGFQIDD